MTKVKICGIQSWGEAKTAVDCGADALGFIFAPSPRRINPEAAREIIFKLPPFVTTVGVFVNEPPSSLLKIVDFCRLDAVQLHGDESPEYCCRLGLKVIKSFRVRESRVPPGIDAFPVQAVLLDTYVPGRPGGTGLTFDWEVARRVVAAGRTVILAGGLTPENVARAVAAVRPYAVDVASGVESGGRKDPDKVRRFIEAAKRAGEEIKELEGGN
ncbi:MAG: phosphoribosylanthranilate isomerase [Clostridia bacterium]|nr:phosphoribosylanthranilate isomerase [Clostridia bacterium]